MRSATFDQASMRRALTRALEVTGVKGASLAVSYAGRRVCVGVGVADADGAPVTTRHQFSIGSIAKLWTAHMTVALAAAGDLDLHAPVRDILPEFDLQDREAAAEISAFHLLTHTSGIDGDYLTTPPPEDAAGYVRSLADAPQLHRPGAWFSYCNAGFVVLAEMHRRLTGKTWDAAVRDILAPLEAEATMLASAAADVPRAVGWRRDAQGAFSLPLPHRGGLDALAAWGDTARATAPDLLSYAVAVLESGAALGEGWMERVWARQVEGPRVGDGWGLGWRRWRLGEFACLGHDGSVPGETAYLRLVPARRLAFVLLTNAEDSGGLFDLVFADVCKLAEIVAEAAQRPKPAQQSRPSQAYIGSYRRSGAEIVIRPCGAGLSGKRRVLSRMGGLDSEFSLEPLEGGGFRTTPAFGEEGRVDFLASERSRELFFSTGLRLYPRVN